VSLDTVKKLERLAYLTLTEADRQALAVDLGKILEYAGSLTQLDLSAFSPMTHTMNLADVLRPDTVGVSSSLQEALANAPQAHSPYIQVPRVLE